uniref:Retrovirus-related Pol polyprotein from transposon TNT 1-94 n=1 Tax=Cajanus cajan TaxID=3821 RepID=A0A151S3Y3_CAJCA|nr:hypothetical protein KK1_028719 [Cajanus cajan]
MQGIKQGNLYILQGYTMTSIIFYVFGNFDNSLWHMLWGHITERGIKVLCKQGLLGNHKMKHLPFREHYVYGKKHKQKFPKIIHTTKATLNYIHSNCWGSSRVPSIRRARYFIFIIDDYSRMTWVCRHLISSGLVN